MTDVARHPAGALARNAALNLVGQGAPLVIAVVAMPFVVGGLGMDRFGLLTLAWVVLGYLNLFDLGLGKAATKFVAEALAARDDAAVARVAWTALLIQAIVGIVGTAALLALTPFLVGRMLNVPPELAQEATATFRILALSAPVTLLFNASRGLLEAAERFDLVNAVRAPLNSTTYLVPLAGAFGGWRLPAIVGLLVAARAAGFAVQLWLAMRVLPPLRTRPRIDRAEAPRLLGFGGWVTVAGVLGPLLLYLDRFLIGALLTMAAVGYYAAPFEAMTRLWIVPGAIAAALFPAFSAAGRRVDPRVLAFHDTAVRFLLVGIGPALVAAAVLARPILELWLGAAFADQAAAVFGILLIGSIPGLLAPLPGTILQGLGRPDLLARVYLAEVPANALLVWGLVSAFGLPGAAASYAIRTVGETLVLFALAARVVREGEGWAEGGVARGTAGAGQGPRRLGLPAGAGRIAVALAALGAALWAATRVPATAAGITLGGVAIAVFAVVAWTKLLTEEDRALVLRRVRHADARTTFAEEAG
jgi:O-antigen/teichoic acid export membrane protein